MSCKKEYKNEAVKINVNSANKNQELIKVLIAGQPFTIDNNSTNLLTQSSTNSVVLSSTDGGGYSVSLVNSMLKFNSTEGMLNFLGALDATSANWDINLDPELEGLTTEKNIAGDPTKNAFDAAMGFNSLRKKYEMDYYDDPDFKTSLLVNINEEDARTVLNTNNEVQIGTTIYKFIGTDIIAEILNEDYSTLQFLRDHPGLSVNSSNLTLKDANTGTPLPKSVILGPLGECSISVTTQITEKYQGDYRQVFLTVIPETKKDGITAYCGYTYYIQWGDGFATDPNNPKPGVAHTYNVSPSAGSCNSFNISVTVKSLRCSITDCENKTGNASRVVTICNKLEGCGQNTSSVPSAPTYFTFGGINYRIIGEVGAQHATGWWLRRNMIYSRTFWQKQNGSKWLPTSNKKVHLTSRVYGPIYLNNCTTTSQRDVSATKRNQPHVEANDYIAPYYTGSFGYTRVEPNVIKSDHYVFIDIGAGYTASIIGHKLK